MRLQQHGQGPYPTFRQQQALARDAVEALPGPRTLFVESSCIETQVWHWSRWGRQSRVNRTGSMCAVGVLI